MEQVETVIVGGGQAGMATSYWLNQHGHEHVVLERAAEPANVWRNNRWDSFTMVTPSWALKMPGTTPNGASLDGFMPRHEIIDFFTNYASEFQVPIRFGTSVEAVEPASGQRFRVETQQGPIDARNVVIATGIFQFPKLPRFASRLAPGIVQLHSDAYRNPDALPPGAVLVVGTAMSGCQIAEELYQQGRKVYLSTAATGRIPRRYRGRDIIWWLETIGFFDLTIEQMPPGSTRFDSIPHISGSNGGHTLNLHQFARDGVTLLGRMVDVDGTTAQFAPNLHENLARADGFEAMVTGMIDGAVQERGLDAPVEELPQLRDGFDQPIIETLDLEQAGITSVIWATGYGFDFSMVNLPVRDGDGFPIQDRGVTGFPGLYFVGLPWMPSERSGFLIGVGESARHIAANIVNAYATA
jgi:putative flavoprotein involved in K+ transport